MLRITDRKKSLIVTSGGKNVAPQPMEVSLTSNKYIEQCNIVGDDRNFSMYGDNSGGHTAAGGHGLVVISYVKKV